MRQSLTIDDVLTAFRLHGHRSYGESVTELQHALQCAVFAQRAGESDAMVAAALLHDFGHLHHDAGEDVAERGIDMHHEDLGAARLRRLFGPEIVEPIRLHVDAKRYLCWRSREYRDELSPASLLSLQLQGGPMTDAEAAEFENRPHAEAALRLRRYDDLGKVPEMATPELDDFRPLLESLVS